MSVKAIVLAAGKGIRMKPLTDEIPKAMVKVAGKPILEWILENLGKAGITDVLLVVGYKRQKIKEYFRNKFNGMRLDYVWQVKQQGTGNAIAVTENYNDADEFIVMNGDVIVESQLIEKLANEQGFDAVVVAREEKEPWKFGCLKVEGKFVSDVIEKPKKGEEPSYIVSCGIFKFSRKIYDELREIKMSVRGEYELTDALKKLIGKGKVGFILNQGICIDVGCPEDLPRAEKELGNKM